jgi:hypothetical protein
MTMNKYYTGDDIAITGSLLRNGRPMSEGLTGTLACALVKRDRSGRANGTTDVSGSILDPVLCTFSAIWPRSQTGAIDPGIYWVEVQVTQGDQVHTFIAPNIEIIRGVVV